MLSVNNENDNFYCLASVKFLSFLCLDVLISKMGVMIAVYIIGLWYGSDEPMLTEC